MSALKSAAFTSLVSCLMWAWGNPPLYLHFPTSPDPTFYSIFQYLYFFPFPFLTHFMLEQGETTVTLQDKTKSNTTKTSMHP